jgi:single-strand DNA-binding protein
LIHCGWIGLFHVTYAWTKLAEYAAGFKKGAHVRIEGELRSREYETDAGVKVRTYVIVASSIMNLRPGQRTTASHSDVEPAGNGPHEIAS